MSSRDVIFELATRNGIRFRVEKLGRLPLVRFAASRPSATAEYGSGFASRGRGGSQRGPVLHRDDARALAHALIEWANTSEVADRPERS